MKKILYTIFTIFFLVACHQEEIDTTSSSQESDKVTLSLSLQIPEAQSLDTRAFNDDGSNIDKLFLAVFNENGFLEEMVKATNLVYTPTETEGYTPSNGEVCFEVELKQSSYKRTIHFIAYQSDGESDELTEQIKNMEYGSESALISSLNVSGTKDAYWQRKEFPNGIRDNEETKGMMRRVPLVRNFAKIIVRETDDDFVITKIAIVNPASKGSVAPYFDGGFAVFNNGETALDYSTIKGSGYNGYSPYGAIPAAGTLSDYVNWAKDATEVSTYLYERNQTSNEAYLLVAGKWKTNSETFYKVDLVDAKNVRYNILRNFQYTVTITSVVGDGHPDAPTAIANPAGNNISGSTEMESFLNISDGEKQLFVTYTKKTLVSGNPVYDLKYKYISNVANGTNSTLEEGAVTIDAPAGDVLETTATPSTKLDDGWCTLELNPYEPTSIPKTQDIIISAGGLQRKITLTLREAYELSVSCTESVADKMGAPVDVFISIQDDLPSYLFPLTFFVESSALSIYPDASRNRLPVNTRTTVVDNMEGNSFGFDRELTWAEYETLKQSASNGKVSIPCYFLTNKDNSASNIYVYHELFNKDKYNFVNITMKEFTETSISTSIVGIEQTVTYSFKTETDANVTINIIEGNQRTTVTKEVKGNLKNEFTYNTQTWGQGIEIILSAYGYLPTTMEGRRTLIIPVQNLKATNIRKSSNNYISGVSISDVSVYADSNHSQLIGTIKFNSDGNMSSDLTLDVTGLNDDNHLYFTYTATEWNLMSSSSKTYSTNATIRDILKEDGIKQTFVEQ